MDKKTIRMNVTSAKVTLSPAPWDDSPAAGIIRIYY